MAYTKEELERIQQIARVVNTIAPGPPKELMVRDGSMGLSSDQIKELMAEPGKLVVGRLDPIDVNKLRIPPLIKGIELTDLPLLTKPQYDALIEASYVKREDAVMAIVSAVEAERVRCRQLILDNAIKLDEDWGIESPIRADAFRDAAKLLEIPQ